MSRSEKLKDRIFRKLFAAAEIAKFTPEEARAYEDSLKVYRDLKNSIDTAREEGREEGIALVAINLLNMGQSIEDVRKATGLTPEQIEKLRKDEARANAFAIEFLAPGKKVESVFRSESSASAGLKKVMEVFGLSYTAARFHIFNSLSKTIDLEQLTSTGYSIADNWQAQENFTVDFFKPESVPFSRRGRFAYEVVKAEETRKISTNAAAIWLGCSTLEYQKEKETIKSFFE